MKALKFIGFALLAISLGLTGCNETPVEPTPEPTPEEVKSEIIIDPNIIFFGLSFTSDAGEKSISFTTNEDWTLSIAPTPSGEKWCTASATNGAKGDADVQFAVKENESYDNRSVAVTIKSGTASQTFTISQKGVDALLLTTNKYELSQEGGTIEIEVKSNIQYEMEIAENAKDWIKESTTKTRDLSVFKHSFEIAASEDYDKREGEIYFKSEDKLEVVKVYQAGAGAIILLSKNEYYASSTGETITVDLRSNCEYEVEMPDVEWLNTVPETRAMSSHTLQYEILPNEAYDNRNTRVIFKDINGTTSDTLHIIQNQKDAILLSKKEIEVNFTGGAVDVKLETNVDFEIIMPEEGWVTENATRALTTHTRTFYINENESVDNRSCYIVFKNSIKSVADTLTINQKGKSNYLYFEKDIAYWTPDQHSQTIKIHSDMAYELCWLEKGWISWLDHWGEESGSVSIQLLENTSVKPRSTMLVAKSRTLSDTLTIVQHGVKGIELSEASFEVDHIGDTIILTVDANIEYTMIDPKVDWIKVEAIQQEDFTLEKTNITYNSSTVKLIISALKSFENSRMEHIIFDSPIGRDNQYDQTLTIKQYKKIGNSYTMEQLYRQKDNFELEELCITGDVTRNDFNYLRRLAGGDVYYHRKSSPTEGYRYTTKTTTNPGKLKRLDLSKANIVYCGFYPANADRGSAIEWQDKNTLDYYHLSATKLETIVLPENLEYINVHAFEECTELKNIICGGKLRYVLNGAFNGCNKLQQITFPQKVKFEYKDGYSSVEFFKGCSELTDITFLGDFYWTDNALEKFNYNTYETLFEDTKLKNLVINGNCRNIPPYAFYNCYYLEGELNFKGTRFLGKQAFYNCENVSKISFEDATFTTIDERTFFFCKKLTSIELPASLQKIGSLAFARCDELETISIPESVNYVDELAFSNDLSGASNKSLKAIYCYPTTPPETKSTKYSEHTILYVPKGCLGAYEKSQWGLNFKTIVEME